VSTLRQWFDEWDTSITASRSKQIAVDVSPALREITLLVIASAGFGMQFKRSSQEQPAAGYSMSFGDALFTAIDKLNVKVLAPNWMYSLPIPALRRTDTAYSELKRYIGEMIVDARRGKPNSSRGAVSEDQPNLKEAGAAADLFRRLVAANEEEGTAKLSEDELLSNIFVSLSPVQRRSELILLGRRSFWQVTVRELVNFIHLTRLLMLPQRLHLTPLHSRWLFLLSTPTFKIEFTKRLAKSGQTLRTQPTRYIPSPSLQIMSSRGLHSMLLKVEHLFSSRFQSPGSYFGLLPASSSSPYSSSSNSQEYTLAVFRETLRLFPATVRVRRDAVFDTTLPSCVRDPDSGEWVSGPPVKVPAGVPCILNIHGVHMSRTFGKLNMFSPKADMLLALYWGADAEEFRPDRFIDTASYQWPREACAYPTTCPARLQLSF